MIFDRQNKAACIIPETPSPDPRCTDSEFSLAHPDVCESQGALILKPGIASLCVLDSVQFRVFDYKGGVETELTSGVMFSSSNADAFVIGVNGGAGTALAAGSVTITATYGERTVSAKLEVAAGANCCDDQIVLTSIVIDNSRSMSLNFGGGYSTRLDFAKAIATSFGGSVLAKDSDKAWKSNSSITELVAAFTSDSAAIIAAVATVTQTQEKTDLLPVFEEAAQDLIDATANRRVLLLISDGEQTFSGTSRQDVIDAAALFKGAGGVVVVIGARASGLGFDLLERIATGGFFVNASSDSASDVFLALNYLKHLLCAGTCLPEGDIHSNLPSLDYSNFQNWEALSGLVNLLGPGLLDLMPGNGLYVETAHGSKGVLRTIDSFDLVSGKVYGVSLDAAGNQREELTGQGLKIYLREVGAAASDANIFEQAIYPAWDDAKANFHFSFTAAADKTVKLYIEQLGDDAAPASGNLIDNVVLENVSDGSAILTDSFDDENLTYIPPRCGPNAAVSAIADPDGPSVYNEQFNGTQTICNGDTYTYAVSWVTLGGETAASSFETLVSIVDDSCVIRVILPTPPPEATDAHIWRNIADGDSSNLYLLATVNPFHETYFDLEDHAAFGFRADLSLTPPTENTTSIAPGDLGIGYADCCYYESSPNETQSIYSVSFPNNVWARKTAALTGAANNKKGTVSFWVKTSGGIVVVGNDNSEDLVIDVDAFGNVYFNAFNSGHVGIMQLQSTGSILGNGWHHVVASWDLSDPAKCHLYVDGVSDLLVAAYVNDSLNWQESLWTIGPAGGGDPSDLLCELWVDNSYLDLSLESNRLKFRTGSGLPGILGLDGSAPTGNVPLIYFRKRVPEWHLNQGSGQGFSQFQGALVDGGTDVPGGAQSQPGAFETTFTDNCPNCDEAALNAQESDSSPLPDIESAFTPPVVYSSTRTRCATCPTGFVNLVTDGAEHSLVSNVLNADIRTTVHLTGAAIVPYFYQIGGDPAWFPTAWTFEGSNDGSTWAVLDTRASQTFFASEVKKVLVVGNSTAYAYYRFVITTWSGTPDLPQPPVTASDMVFPAASAPICATATETSVSNQHKADTDAANAATEAATALLNCVQIFTSTKSYTANDCPSDPPGPGVPVYRKTTRSATRSSLISLADAEALAQSAAEASVAEFQNSNPCP